MKLAEALQERADLNRRIEQLRYRLNNNVLMQEGEKPTEDPAVLLGELSECFSRLEWLISRINLTNCAVKVDGRTLTELIARRDVLSLQAEAYSPLAFGRRYGNNNENNSTWIHDRGIRGGALQERAPPWFRLLPIILPPSRREQHICSLLWRKFVVASRRRKVL